MEEKIRKRLKRWWGLRDGYKSIGLKNKKQSEYKLKNNWVTKNKNIGFVL